jgi:O-antigen/teichoic acid export membrane protein
MAARTVAIEQGAPAAGSASPARLGRNVAMLSSSQAITWIMSLAWTVVVPRALGPAGLGEIVAALSVSGLIGIVLGLGTKPYLVREMVVRPASAPSLVGTALVLRTLLAPLYAIVTVGYALIAHVHGEALVVLYLIAASTFLALLAEPFQAAFQAVERMEYLAYSDVIGKSAQALIGVALALIGVRAVGMAVLAVAIAVVVVVLDAVWLHRLMAIVLRTTARRLAGLARASVAYWAFGVFFVLYLSIDTVMLSLMTSSTVVGWYGVPTKLFQTLMFLPAIVGTAWLPRLVSAFGDGVGALREASRTPIAAVVSLSLPICAATVAMSGPVIRLLYGPAYANAVPVMVVLGLCVPPMYVNIMLNQVLVAADRQSSWTWAMLAAVIVNPALNLVLIRWTQAAYGNGAIGAAASLVLTEILIVGIGIRLLGTGVLQGLWTRRTLAVAAASLALLAASFAAGPLGSVASVAAGAGALIASALLLRLVTIADLRAAPRAAGRLVGRST